MPNEIYELIAQGARYWFLFLMLLIAWRSWRWYRKDKKQARKRRKLLPDAGFVGELVVVQGGGPLERGSVLSVPREGTLGSMRTNDLCIPVSGVAKRHLWFRFDDGEGLMVEPFGKNALAVDGEAFQSRRQPLYMLHGSRLYVGGAELRLRLFAGFECMGHAPRRVEEEPAPPQPAPDQAQIAEQQMWMQRQWMMQQQAYQQGYQQAMAQQRQQPAPVQEAVENDMADAYSYEAARAQGRVDDRAFMRPQGVPRPELPAYEPEEIIQPQSVSAQTEFEPQETFFAPVMDEDAWDDGLPEDEDMTDAAAPPKSAYVGHDEAESAKKKVWDRYLGGGRR